MATPPDPVLWAALRWLEHLPQSNLARTRALFTSHSAYSDITPTQYAAAYTWLLENGFVDEFGTIAEVKCGKLALFEAAISESLWISDADVLVVEPSALPEDALRAAVTLELDVDSAFAAVQHLWGKVDAAERLRIGTAGELALIELLAATACAKIDHVAAYSDGYGYDIAVTLPGSIAHLEVKATTRRGRLTIYLSRNEFETMRKDPDWTLVIVRLDQNLKPASIATVDTGWIASAAPRDCHPAARWDLTKFDVPPEALSPGLPSIAESDPPSLPPLLRGLPPWPG
ncbi:DUF3883 domain-containing protein [Rhodococcus opacus]|uniref:DUF3883 domain-containing protein n=1 Tax=Rhodococcus opacus TaxID=37919 RepID=UPI0024B8F979|nr:DUF3883 domain-containing protein [Rhodococcus opacus]MDJ0412824.1 DUF3883 domain-containing protein [Rhodococcus opacus]